MRAPMLEVEQGGDRLVHDVAATTAVHVHNHGNPARIVFERGVIQPDALRRHTHLTLQQTFCAAAFADSTGPHPEVAGKTPSVLSIGCPSSGRDPVGASSVQQ